MRKRRAATSKWWDGATELATESGTLWRSLLPCRGPLTLFSCDIDKESYPRALPVARSLLRVGGYFVCDNMLWKSRLLQARGDAATEGVRSLTRLLLEAQDLVTAILPVHDGLSVSLRIS
jgi:predicted O-methyltransferase YrrM